MSDKVKYNKFGKIKSRAFAFILLMLSCSLGLTAFRSLGRSFNGLVVHKEIHNGFIQNNYDLYIEQNDLNNSKVEISNKDVINILALKLDDYTKIGVSYFVYEAAEKSMIVKKIKNSPIIDLNGETYIDQGLFWGIMSLIGIILSILIYRQTLIVVANQIEDENELNDEIEL